MDEPTIRLTPGILLDFLIDAIVPLSYNTSNYNDRKACLLFSDLIKITYPDLEINQKTADSQLSSFRSCKKNTAKWAPLLKNEYILSTNEYFNDKYLECIKNLIPLTNRYFSTSQTNINNIMLIKKILTTIKKDETISNDQTFFITYDKKAITKEEMLKLHSFQFQPFIFGVWYFLISNKIDNLLGEDTYNYLYKKYNEQDAAHFYRTDYTSSCHFGTITIDILQENHSIFSSDALNLQSIDPDIIKNYLDKLFEEKNKPNVHFYCSERKSFYDYFVCSDLISSSEYNFVILPFDKNSGNKTRIKDVTISKLTEKNGKKILITGTGGLGKSTMMTHLTLNAIQEYNNTFNIPIFIKLNLVDSNFIDLEHFTYSCIKNIFKISFDEFKHLLTIGKLIFFFDGYDEINSKYLKRFELKLQEFITAYSTCTFIISSRPYLQSAGLNSFFEFPLMPLTKEQTIELIQKLDADETNKSNFINYFMYISDEDKDEFFENPLLLTIMFLTFEYKQTLILSECQFYNDAFDALAEKHDSNKIGFEREYKTRLNKEQLKTLFSEFCCKLYEEEIFTFTEIEVNEIFCSLKKPSDNCDNLTLSNFLEDLTKNICMFIKDGIYYSFVHRSFQEYFSALYYSKQSDEFFRNCLYSNYLESNPRNYNDETLSYLNVLSKNKVTKNLVIPYVLENFSNLDKTNFWEFMDKAYEKIVLTCGLTDQGHKMVSGVRSPILKILFNNINVDDTVFGDFLFDYIEEAPQEFVYLKYYQFMDGYDQDGNDAYVIYGSDYIQEYQLDINEGSLVGFNVEIPVKDLISNHDDEEYKDIMKRVETDNESDFIYVYNQFIKFCKTLKH